MPKTLLTGLKWFLFLAVLIVGSVWIVLATAFFSDWRKSLIENALSEQVGHPFEITGDARVVLGATTRTHVSQARIPSTKMPGTDLVQLNLMEFELNLPALLGGRIQLDNLVLDGLQVNLLTDEQGDTSWTPIAGRIAAPEEPTASTETTKTEDTDRPTLLSFLSNKTVTFTNIGLLFDDRTSGFVFDFNLHDARLEQRENGALVAFTANGSVNEQGFEHIGLFPRGKPFTNDVNFGEMVLGYDGAALPADEGGGYSALLELDTGEVGLIFDILGLERGLEGRGTLSARVTHQADLLAVNDLTSTFDLKEGQNITVQGDVDHVIRREGVDIEFNARLHPEGAPPPTAETLKDFKLTSVSAHVISNPDGIAFEELLIHTNAFDQGLERVGPISFGRFYRTPEETLGVQDLRVHVGPLDAPYITAEGEIDDVFKFKKVTLDGTLAASSSLLLTSLSEEDAARFGKVTAEFVVSDAPGHLALSSLSARTEDTDLWSFRADAAIEDVTKLAGVLVEFSLNVLDSSDFLAALKADPVDIGALALDVDLRSQGQTARLGIGFKAGGSDISTNLTADVSQEVNVVRGDIVSERIRLEDIRDGVKAVLGIANSSDRKKDAPEPEPDDGKPPLQPLVLEEKDKGVFNPYRILTATDLEIGIALNEFVGKAGTSSMTSQLIADQGQIKAGPLDLRYGGGFLKVTAEMDAVNTPEILRVHGGTNGWDFGEILDSVGLGIKAHGTLGANFDVTGDIHPPKQFPRSASGWATLDMGRGSIATSLLELAGLGVFPWLFSEERRAKETTIVCMKAPVTVTPGRVASDKIVLETNSVQLFMRGEVDWARDSIALRGEPRRVGKPLSRSAWPFDVTGKLSDPEFKLQVGGSRSRRADGADQMPENRKPCVPDIYQLE